MLWYKHWIDTRWRFFIGLALLTVAACGVVLLYREALQLLETTSESLPAGDGAAAEALRVQLAAIQTFRGYVWFQWFDENFSMLATVFAALLGSGHPLSASGHGLLFSLALPVSRSRWMRVRASVGLAELFALCLLPALAIVLTAPLVGERFALLDASVHAVSAFGAAAVFFAVASLLSTVFSDVWRPLLLTCALALALGFAELLLPEEYGLFDVMSAASYFSDGSLPWLGLAVSVALTGGLLVVAAANVERQDY